MFVSCACSPGLSTSKKMNCACCKLFFAAHVFYIRNPINRSSYCVHLSLVTRIRILFPVYIARYIVLSMTRDLVSLYINSTYISAGCIIFCFGCILKIFCLWNFLIQNISLADGEHMVKLILNVTSPPDNGKYVASVAKCLETIVIFCYI